LWRHVWVSLPVELLSLVLGAWLYTRSVPAQWRLGDRWLWGFASAMAALEVYAALGPAPDSAAAVAATALGAYAALALLAGLVDRARATG
jgi:hypothetical protein